LRARQSGISESLFMTVHKNVIDAIGNTPLIRL